MSEPRRWWIYPLEDGTLQAAPVSPTWGGGGILVEEVDVSSGHIKPAGSEMVKLPSVDARTRWTLAADRLLGVR